MKDSKFTTDYLSVADLNNTLVKVDAAYEKLQKWFDTKEGDLDEISKEVNAAGLLAMVYLYSHSEALIKLIESKKQSDVVR